jgi:uncharacterized DUF497 family protein
MVTFEWDGSKATTNERKHGVGFVEASTVFDDPIAMSAPDIEHSEDERRWVTIGRSASGRVILVIHTMDSAESDEEVIRIVSARRTTPRETRQYNDG